MALNFQDEGYEVGYFKPIGLEMGRTPDGSPYDGDVALMKDTLGLDLPSDTICPIILKSHYLEETMKVSSDTYSSRIMESFEEVSQGVDVLLIEGFCSSAFGTHFDLSTPKLSKLLDSRILLISIYESDCAVDEMLREKVYIEYHEGELIGFVLNDVKRRVFQRAKELILPILEKRDLKNWGIIPWNVGLTSPTVREICDNLGGELLACRDRLDALVEEFLVGAMTPESALSYFRRSRNKAVVTGGDRSDIALAALETDTSILILTGNLYPSVRVLAKADEKSIPVLLVPYDTYTTIDKVAQISGKIKPGDSKRIELTKESVTNNVDWRGLLDTLLR